MNFKKDFFTNVRKLPNGCWRYVSNLGHTEHDYPIAVTYEGVKMRAHRMSYWIASDKQLEDLKGLVIFQTCLNRYCVNPDHLKALEKKDYIKFLNELDPGLQYKTGRRVWGTSFVDKRPNSSDTCIHGHYRERGKRCKICSIISARKNRYRKSC